ncbi:MAG: hypothetical protein ACK4LQ_09490 [Pararhodobacter sp.]
MPSDRSIGATLKKLGAALLNATLLLVVLALVLMLVLSLQLRGMLREVQGAAQDGLRSELVQFQTQLSETRASAAAALTALEARAAAEAPAPGAIRPAFDADADAARLRALLEDLTQRLDALEQSPPGLTPPGGAANADADERFLRWLALSIIRRAALEFLSPAE